MAQVTPLSRHLQLQLQVGTQSDGTPKIGNHNYTHVLPSASDDDVLAVGQALAGLFNDPLVQVTRVDETALAATSSTTA
ncbi:DUF1659 domain-containing protein [Alicyclobacillus sp. SO9]|uniref:DUF1659 domain-containing protein n=1 Tax=Alicyclobacillus sp. SO9 TaxID=2665646 RepID=UPI0018E7EE5D|nr:DUF1659 domain-containing protein [Alicyclobacillus sp. SO9]QQE78613.1 DUF1659 domain-containing protein [Alicyclobacillus sp. SO9]